MRRKDLCATAVGVLLVAWGGISLAVDDFECAGYEEACERESCVHLGQNTCTEGTTQYTWTHLDQEGTAELLGQCEEGSGDCDVDNHQCIATKWECNDEEDDCNELNCVKRCTDTEPLTGCV